MPTKNTATFRPLVDFRGDVYREIALHLLGIVEQDNLTEDTNDQPNNNPSVCEFCHSEISASGGHADDCFIAKTRALLDKAPVGAPMNQYERKNVAFKHYGYLIARPNETPRAAFDRAKKELVTVLERELALCRARYVPRRPHLW